jgi:signal peptidase I
MRHFNSSVLLSFVCAALLGIGAVTLPVWLLSLRFSVMEMGSTSMQPLIAGQGAPPSRIGDFVVVAKWFRVASLRTGDLVVVNIPSSTGRVRTLRKIEQQPDTPAGQFYVRAVTDIGIDSRQFGPLKASNIYGRVIYIIR